MNPVRQSSTESSVLSSSPSSDGSYAEMDAESGRRLLPPARPLPSAPYAYIPPKHAYKGNHSRGAAVPVLVVISLVFSALSLAMAAVVLCWTMGGPGAGGDGGRGAEVCIPCLQVSPNPLETDVTALTSQLTVKPDPEDGDAQLCCARHAAQYAALFKLILQRQEEVKKLADFLGSTPNNNTDIHKEPPVVGVTSGVSAHVVFKESAPVNVHGVRFVQQWKAPDESPLSHVTSGLEFRQNRFFVQTPGRYFVYCQVLYSPSTPDPGANPYEVVSAYVRRYSILRPQSPDFLLKSRHTRHARQSDRHSSYAGGVFSLAQGDTLFVQVVNPHALAHDDFASFFGLFRVGD